MRFVNADGRAALLVDDQVFDLERASGGSLSSDPTTVIRSQWAQARALAVDGDHRGGTPLADVHLRPPVPEPRSIYAVGLNYQAHADESGATPPTLPAIFTKFPTAITGPNDPVVLPKGKPMVDWEAELTVVLGDGGRHLSRDDALGHVLGFTCAQDISERETQFQAGAQFSMGKSYDTFCPFGPAIVTLDELDDPGRLHLTCSVNGEVKQDAWTDDLIFDVPALIQFVSSVCTFRAGDLLLTGTPAGVGMAKGTFLAPGDVIETVIEGVGSLRNECIPEH